MQHHRSGSWSLPGTVEPFNDAFGAGRRLTIDDTAHCDNAQVLAFGYATGSAKQGIKGAQYKEQQHSKKKEAKEELPTASSALLYQHATNPARSEERRVGKEGRARL